MALNLKVIDDQIELTKKQSNDTFFVCHAVSDASVLWGISCEKSNAKLAKGAFVSVVNFTQSVMRDGDEMPFVYIKEATKVITCFETSVLHVF